MTPNLVRLKPSPIPPIRPVPEAQADARLHEVYEDTKSVLQVPWMGVVTMAFAHYPNFYSTLWQGVRDLAQSREFVASCKTLRNGIEKEASAVEAQDLRPALGDNGYDAQQLREIRDEIEIFSHGNMPYLMIATIARLLLEGHEFSENRSLTRFDGHHGPSTHKRLKLVEPHEADTTIKNVYDDIKATLGLPFVNTDYRALARWPKYFPLAWQDLKPHIATEAYQTAVTHVHEIAINISVELPNSTALTSQQLREAASQDGDIDEITDVVRLFQWLLPGLVVNVAHFRQQLGPC